MGGRAGGGIGGFGSRAIGGNDFAREAVSHPLIASLQKKDLDKTLASIDANIKDPQMKAEMKAVVEKMYKEMGGLPRGYEVKLVSQSEGKRFYDTGGWNGKGGEEIWLNKNHFGRGYKHAEEYAKKSMESGWSVTTNKPALKTFVHEFGHGYYDRLSKGGKEQVGKIFSQFKASKSTKGWGTYSKTNASEFFSDAVAKSVLGGSDKWTKALGKIK